MSTDSYSQILEMQSKAMKRAESISRQEKDALESERQLNFNSKAPEHTSLPLNIPKKKESDNKEKLLSFPDTDRAVLLSILLLLKSEGADEILILALLYILA